MYIAIDIGGTKTLVALLDENKNNLAEVKFETPNDFDSFKSELQNSTREICARGPFIKGAIGCRGIIDRAAKTLVYDDKLAWRDAPLGDFAEDIFGCDFSIENDAKLAGLAEALAIEPIPNNVLYITVSTGVNCALITGGKLDQDTVNSEIGKWIIASESGHKSLESIASGSYLTATYGKRASELEDPEAWKAFTANLAIGIFNACAAYTPDLIILGGGVGTHFQKYKDYLLENLDALRHPMVKIPQIQGAQDAEKAVINGCYELARQKA